MGKIFNSSIFITELNGKGSGPTLAVKDVIDVVDVPTTAGSRVVAEHALSAPADALCLAGARAAHARIVGKANLHELAFGAAGINEWFGTPRNPIDPSRIPGGSSSGSAVAVAVGDAQIAYGSDSGGSIRVPAACCGVSGLKTTWGRVPLAGVWPVAPDLDTVGPIARDVGGLIAGMSLLEPGFAISRAHATRIGRVRPVGNEVDPVIDASIDTLLEMSGIEVEEVEVPGWSAAFEAGTDLLVIEAAEQNAPILANKRDRMMLSKYVRERLGSANNVNATRRLAAQNGRRRFLKELSSCFQKVELLALPTMAFFPPRLEEAYAHSYTFLTMPVNIAGLPAISLPVPSGSGFPASLQLIGPNNSEELLCATGLVLEAVATTL